MECLIVAVDVEASGYLPDPNWISGLSDCTNKQTTRATTLGLGEPKTEASESDSYHTYSYSADPTLPLALDEVLLIFGGVNEILEPMKTSELVLKSDVEACRHTFDLPIGLESPTGGVISTKTGQSLPVTCGGHTSFGNSIKNCSKLGGDPTLFAELTEAKYGVSSVLLHDGQTLWVTGG